MKRRSGFAGKKHSIETRMWLSYKKTGKKLTLAAFKISLGKRKCKQCSEIFFPSRKDKSPAHMRRTIFCSRECHDNSRRDKKLPTRSAEWCANISKANKGKVLSKSHRKKLALAHLGIKHKPEVWKKRSRTWQKNGYIPKPPIHRGKNHPMWRGGVTPRMKILRNSIRYRIWRKAVFERDQYACLWCGDDRGRNLEADHIKPFAFFPKLRFQVKNGRTLCEPCHRKTDTWGRKKS